MENLKSIVNKRWILSGVPQLGSDQRWNKKLKGKIICLAQTINVWSGLKN
jgi:hypothetical protein